VGRKLLFALRFLGEVTTLWDMANSSTYRALWGGRWEQWWIGSPVNSYVWLNDLKVGERPGLGEYREKVEDYSY
jgi:hypothetical protein